MTVSEDEERGKLAITDYEILEEYDILSLVKLNLKTGRTHQIRVHLKLIGHPLFNDIRYGGDRLVKGTIFTKYKQFVQNCFKLMPRFPLHARSLDFTHPRTGERMFFEVPLPNDFQQLLDKWRKYVLHKKEGILENELENETEQS